MKINSLCLKTVKSVKTLNIVCSVIVIKTMFSSWVLLEPLKNIFNGSGCTIH